MEQLHQFISWIVGVVGQWGYPGIFVLMCLESTFVPVPSEIVMPPAGYLASLGQMNLAVAILMGTLGSMAGASINYALAVFLGRPFLLKYGKFMLCPPHKFEKVEKFFLAHGEIGTFTGRLIIGVRHFISFPAGLARMKMSHFLALTGVGSAIWCGILAAIGYYIGKASERMTREQMDALFTKYGKQAGVLATLACVAIIGVYVYVHRRKQRRAAAAASSG
jgi:membrane protein DedA with SNARE-associated domain